METLLVNIALNVKPKVRKATMQGRAYDVVPCVMIMEGVHNGSKGPLYYPAEEIRKSATLWDHKPVVIYHPPDGTACDETVLNERGAGMLLKTRVVGVEAKLKTEAWMEHDRLATVSAAVAEAIANGTPLEGSTGLLVDVDWTEGEWRGERYAGIARNYRPDHYAVLPDQAGACSRRDGAGFLVNQASEDAETDVDSAQSFNSVIEQIRSAVRVTRPNAYVKEVFSDSAVYSDGGQLYSQGYEIKDDVVSLLGVPELVVRVVSYKPKSVVTNTEQDAMDKKKLVEELVGVKNGGLEDADQAELEGLSEKSLRAMIVNAQVKAGGAGVQSPVKPKNLTEFLDTVPADYQPIVRNGVAAYNAKKEELVQNVLKCLRNKFTVEQLRAKDLDELSVLNELAKDTIVEKPANDFGGQGDVVANATADDVLPLPVMNFTE